MAKPEPQTPDSSERVAYRVKEVAEMTGIPASTIRTRIHAGEINVITGFGTWLIGKSELNRLLSITLRDE